MAALVYNRLAGSYHDTFTEMLHGYYIPAKEHREMKRTLVIIVAVSWLGFPRSTVAQSPTAPASAPTTAPAKSGEYELPEGPDGVVAQVGREKILVEDLLTILDKIPYRVSPQKRREIWESNLASMIYGELLHAYLEANKVPDAPDELTALHSALADEVEKYNYTASLRLLPEITKRELMERRGLNEQRLSDQARYEKLLAELTTNEKLLDFMNRHPEYFNGTSVHIGHIMIACSPLAPTAEQKKAIETLEKIAADVRAGKITFAQAAHEFSQCPSGQTKGPEGKTDYGDLGSWKFFPLAVTFGASFGVEAMKTNVGSLSDVVRSNQGFHLIKVFERIEGNEPPGAETAGIARMGVTSLVENQVFRQALSNVPIVIYKAARKVPKPQPKQ